jgi:hypothetical protein
VILLVYKEQLVHYPEALHARQEKNYINIFEAYKTGIPKGTPFWDKDIFLCGFILDQVSSITTTRHIIQHKYIFLNFLRSFFQQEKKIISHTGNLKNRRVWSVELKKEISKKNR